MIKPSDPRQLALDLLPRSTCAVKVAAVLVDDSRRIFAWGWNSAGNGLGEHAEAAAIRRASKKRLRGATIYVASERTRNGKVVCSKPCPECLARIRNWGLKVVYRDSFDRWV